VRKEMREKEKERKRERENPETTATEEYTVLVMLYPVTSSYHGNILSFWKE